MSTDKAGRASCRYGSAVHSADRVTVHCGQPEPVILCGYHASTPWIKTALNDQLRRMS